MKSISVCMIVKNEAETLDKALGSIKKIADEIIIVDTGSTDNTKEIAKKYTEKIFDFVWCDDFSEARNFSFSKATKQYIMWLDADDFIFEQDAQKIIEFKKLRDLPDVVMLKYVTGYDENFKPEFSFYRERILKKSKNFVWQDPVHEVIIPSGQIQYLDASIFHIKKSLSSHGDRNLKIYQNLIKNGKKFSPRQQFYYSRELYFNNLMDDAILQFKNFLSSNEGWVENNIEACLDLAKCFVIKGELNSALCVLFYSFVFSNPRGEILCQIGEIFIKQQKYDQAIFWFNLALGSSQNLKSGAFVSSLYYDFIPALELCVCYYNKGDMEKAKMYHEMAKSLKPNDESVIYNDRFFKKEKSD